jgi:hypothetical protein
LAELGLFCPGRCFEKFPSEPKNEVIVNSKGKEIHNPLYTRIRKAENQKGKSNAEKNKWEEKQLEEMRRRWNTWLGFWVKFPPFCSV